MKNVLIITGGGLNVRFNTDLPKYMFPTQEHSTILDEIISKTRGFDEIVLIVNPMHERTWNIRNYIKRHSLKTPVKVFVLNRVTSSPVETIAVSGVLNKYKHDRLFFKDCDTVYDLEPPRGKDALTYTVKKFGFQVNKTYSIFTGKGIVEKPKIPFWKWLNIYDANIGCYVFPPCSLRPMLFMTNIKSTGVLCGKLQPHKVSVKKYKNYESLKKYGKLISK